MPDPKQGLAPPEVDQAILSMVDRNWPQIVSRTGRSQMGRFLEEGLAGHGTGGPLYRALISHPQDVADDRFTGVMIKGAERNFSLEECRPFAQLLQQCERHASRDPSFGGGTFGPVAEQWVALFIAPGALNPSPFHLVEIGEMLKKSLESATATRLLNSSVTFTNRLQVAESPHFVAEELSTPADIVYTANQCGQKPDRLLVEIAGGRTSACKILYGRDTGLLTVPIIHDESTGGRGEMVLHGLKDQNQVRTVLSWAQTGIDLTSPLERESDLPAVYSPKDFAKAIVGTAVGTLVLGPEPQPKANERPGGRAGPTYNEMGM